MKTRFVLSLMLIYTYERSTSNVLGTTWKISFLLALKSISVFTFFAQKDVFVPPTRCSLDKKFFLFATMDGVGRGIKMRSSIQPNKAVTVPRLLSPIGDVDGFFLYLFFQILILVTNIYFHIQQITMALAFVDRLNRSTSVYM